MLDLGRLGVAGVRTPYSDRHGLIFLSHGNLVVESGCLVFYSAGSDSISPGKYDIPYQTISVIMIGPGTTVSHDAIRLMAANGNIFLATGENGVKIYSAPPFGKEDSSLARKQAKLWAYKKTRNDVARKMYALRYKDILPSTPIERLRGIEGYRVKQAYKDIASVYGIPWHGRKYDRQNFNLNDIPNTCLNYASMIMYAAAHLAVAATGTLPPLGFIHEDSSLAFVLDIADLYRENITIHIAFEAASKKMANLELDIERYIRLELGKRFKSDETIAKMIDDIKKILQ
ncbi:MAG: type I-E CRISPR-associated endonuclease Cas1 [Methanobacteriota archaeon]|nr:MAG: type I-E CRISPR-associated endonuclease Cas1 [Euryarchaeota archaeon]